VAIADVVELGVAVPEQAAVISPAPARMAMPLRMDVLLF
jgi:hypothetical protein